MSAMSKLQVGHVLPNIVVRSTRRDRFHEPAFPNYPFEWLLARSTGLMKTSYLVESYCSAIALKNEKWEMRNENCKNEKCKIIPGNFAFCNSHFAFSNSPAAQQTRSTPFALNSPYSGLFISPQEHTPVHP